MAVTQDRLHPVVRAIVEQIAARPRYSSMTPAQARGVPVPLAAAPEAVESVIAQSITGPGGPLALRIYRPQNASGAALVYFHGGGWVIGSIDEADEPCRALANRGRCVVVSVDYRLAPEAKFPGPVEDAYAAVRWVADHAAELGIDAARVAVGGSSAGANLAAAAALVARDRGGPRIAFQLLTVPVTDLRYGAASHDEFATGFGLTRADMAWYAEHYIRTPADLDDPYASVLRADLRGMPPALVITAECDPLRDDGEAYAAKLREVGISATAKRYRGMFHGFMAFPNLLGEAAQAYDDAGAALRGALGGG